MGPYSSVEHSFSNTHFLYLKHANSEPSFFLFEGNKERKSERQHMKRIELEIRGKNKTEAKSIRMTKE